MSSIMEELIGEMDDLEGVIRNVDKNIGERENIYNTIDSMYFSESKYRPEVYETGINRTVSTLVPDREYMILDVDRLSMYEVELIMELFEELTEENVEDANMMISAETKKERKVLPGPFFWADVQVFSNLSVELRGQGSKGIETGDLSTTAEIVEDLNMADGTDLDLKNDIITIKLKGRDIPITKLKEFSSRVQKEILIPEQSIIILCRLSELQGAEGADMDPL